MKPTKIYSAIFVILLLIIPLIGKAQTVKISPTVFTQSWNIQLSTGASLFYGEPKQPSFFPSTYNGNTEWRMGAGIQIGWELSPVFMLRGQSIYGQLSGFNINSDQYLQGDYIEFNINSTININNLISGYSPMRKWGAYLTFGIGLTNYNTEIFQLSSTTLLEQMGHGHGKGIGGRTLEGILLGGIGVNYKINNTWSLQLESVNRFLNTKKMDPLLTSKNDIYNYTSIGITYKLTGKKRNVPTFQRRQNNYSTTTKNTLNRPVENNNSNITKQPLSPPKKAKKPAPKPKPVYPVEKKVKEPVRHIMPAPPRPILEYRVQIRAKYGKPVPLSYLSKRFNIPESKIRSNQYNGYYIYTVGSFDTFSQANYYRKILITKNKVPGAFVVFFKNGRRMSHLPKNLK